MQKGNSCLGKVLTKANQLHSDQNGEVRSCYLPTPEEIQLACVLIRARWSDSERQRRLQTSTCDSHRKDVGGIRIIKAPKGFEYLLDP